MAYTTIDDPSAYFQTILFASKGAQTFDGNSDLQPDMIWNKNRDSAGYDHHIVDSVRGVSKLLRVNSTIAEFTSADSITSLNTDGFTIGNDANGYMQSGSDKIVTWGWKAGGSASNNTDGDITSSVSVNQEAGFSIIKYDSNNTAGQTVGHGLGVTPNFLIFKKIDGATNWHCWSDALATTNYINLNLTDAQSSSSDWLGVSSSLITLKTNWGVTNDGGNFICYAFANKQGYSKFGSYTGNGNADGNFIYLGFKPAFILLKGTANTENWSMYDNKRTGFNVDNNVLYPNANSAEGTSDDIDLLSNGFKIRRQTGLLNDTQNYIYMAFAESPFVTGASAIPTTAR